MNLVPRRIPPPLGLLMTDVLQLVNRGPRMSVRPFDEPESLVPHVGRRFESWSHNGIMIPNLPEPLRFLSMTTIVGSTGAPISDISHRPAPPGGPRNRATLNVSTAATAPGFWGDYRIDTDCELAADGSRWRYGEEVTLEGRFPSFTLTARTPGLAIDLELECTDIVSWFIRMPLYRHLSLLTRYAGTISHEATSYDVAGTCVLEHARAAGSYSLARRPVRHPWLRVPLDFFTYQVLDLGDARQLLLVHVEAQGRGVMTAAFLRDEGGRSVALDRGVSFVIEEHDPAPAVTPDGFAMRLPRRFTWRTARTAPVQLEIEGTVDCPFSWGLGSGYVGGFSFAGTVDGVAVARSTGYIEHIDRRGG